ncbi:MAG: hypothetical protein PUF71_01240 [Firmicutes bacterium]|nr:hypothetical protein [Bacillota bacterium]
MKEMLLAALPWVLCGVAAAIICANLGQKKKDKSKKPDKRMAIGMALGLMLGPALTRVGLWENHGIGIAIGILWGMALASMFPEKGDDQDA